MTAEEVKNLIVGKTFYSNRKEEVIYHFGEDTLLIKTSNYFKTESTYSIVRENGRNYLITNFALLNVPPMDISVLSSYPMIIQLVNPNNLAFNVFLTEKIIQK